MKRIHQQEKEQIKKLFKQETIENVEDRIKILETFLQTENHITASELVKLLNENGYRIEPDFVKDTLKILCRFGFARKSRFEDGLIRYEHLHLGQHHDHMICTKCKNIVEFEDEQLEVLQESIASRYGFHMLQHKMEIYGICSDCLKDREKLMPLVTAKPGEMLVIREVTGGANVRMRLISMGLRVGDTIEIITNQDAGRLVVAVDFKRYILGRGLARKIMVQPKRFQT